ncbi:hypothetical protein H4W81_005873 [Nonomuraea africana]|uniref:Uncharacterized protein n=1 Tax=Nonomuraea africana TaxID=46171 RepID=A0ABR9KM50_9ACTN|nr:hypothetical protein [Nonomuraea africana]
MRHGRAGPTTGRYEPASLMGGDEIHIGFRAGLRSASSARSSSDPTTNALSDPSREWVITICARAASSSWAGGCRISSAAGGVTIGLAVRLQQARSETMPARAARSGARSRPRRWNPSLGVRRKRRRYLLPQVVGNRTSGHLGRGRPRRSPTTSRHRFHQENDQSARPGCPLAWVPGAVHRLLDHREPSVGAPWGGASVSAPLGGASGSDLSGGCIGSGLAGGPSNAGRMRRSSCEDAGCCLELGPGRTRWRGRPG